MSFLYAYLVGRNTVYIARNGSGWAVWDTQDLNHCLPIMSGFKTRKAAVAAAHKELNR